MQNSSRAFDFNRVLSGWRWLLNRDAGRLISFAVVWAVVTIVLLFIDLMVGFTTGLGVISLTYLVDPIFVGALYLVALSDDLVTPMAMLGEAGRRYVGLLIVTLFTTFGIAAATLMLILPGIALAVFWCLAVPVFLMERKNPVESIGASFTYIRGHFWPVLGAFLILAVIIIVLGAIFMFMGVTSEDANIVFSVGVSALFNVTLSILGIYLSAAIYRELGFTGGHDVGVFD